jgi:hypothetical protein
MIICTDTPILPNLAAGRWRATMALSDARVGTVQLIAGGKTLLVATMRDFVRDHIFGHAGGPVALVTNPHIPGRRPPSVVLNLTQEL